MHAFLLVGMFFIHIAVFGHAFSCIKDGGGVVIRVICDLVTCQCPLPSATGGPIFTLFSVILYFTASVKGTSLLRR